MLHCLSTYPHDLWVTIQPILHGSKYRLILPTGDTSLLGCRTLWFQRTCFAIGTPVTMHS